MIDCPSIAPCSTLAVLAQDTVAVDAVLQYFATVVLTPLGIIGLSFGAVLLGLVLFVGKGVPVLSAATMVLLTMMIHERTLTQNILIGPLQSLRSLSRPLSFAIIAVASLAALFSSAGNRVRAVPLVALMMYGFQMYYATNMLVFVDPLKGALAYFSITGMFIVCTVGFGRRIQDAESARTAMEVFAWVGMAFCGMNLLQLLVSPGSAVIVGRFAGVSGNAQQAAGICVPMLLANLYLFGALPPSRLLKWVCAALSGVVGLFLLWTGSRTGYLAAGIGVVLMYRLSLGRAAFAAIAAGVVLVIGLSLFSDSADGIERVIGGEAGNTRTQVFENALSDWASSPILGVMPFGFESGVESSYLRALASLGLVGLLLLLVPFTSMLASMPRALWIGRVDSDVRGLADLYFAYTGSWLAMNFFEGFAFGVLSFPMMALYTMLALGGFLAERRAGVAKAPQDLSDGLDAYAT
jgi:hypothetical protein